MLKRLNSKKTTIIQWLHQSVHNDLLIDILYFDFKKLEMILEANLIEIGFSKQSVFFTHFCQFFFEQSKKTSHSSNTVRRKNSFFVCSKLEDHVRDTFTTLYNPYLMDYFMELEEKHTTYGTPLMNVFQNRTILVDFIEFILYHINIESLLEKYPLN